ncbi:ABC transporter substrate-binding protein [Arthrobacter sp. GCM10027362]|uniref:ABC transporter substrate-binding protein n=1 Tax=Arthrobacter sp. GCM10027362 TaxID=3273379 RepID=UPI0036297635
MKTSLKHAVLAGTAALALALSACGGNSNATGSSADAGAAKVETNTSGVLNVGIDLTYPPYDMLDGGKPAGFDVEFMDAISAELGLKPKYTDTRFAQIVAGIKADRYDVIASTLYISSARDKEVDFVPYFQTGNSIIVKEGQAALATAQDLCGKQVGVVTATVIAKILPAAESDKCKKAGKPAITVKEFPTDPEATQALLSGQVDAQMTDAAVAKTAVEKAKGRLSLSSRQLIYPIAVGLAVQEGNAKMQQALKDGLEAMKASGKYDELLKKYNLEPVDPAVLEESMKQA